MRTEFQIRTRVICVCIALAITISACAGTALRGDSMNTGEHKFDQALDAVVTYVRSEKGWSEDTYRIELRSETSDTLVFWVIHQDDESSAIPGIGKSIELHMNAYNYEFIRVLYCQ